MFYDYLMKKISSKKPFIGQVCYNLTDTVACGTGALFVIINPAPNLKMLGLLQVWSVLVSTSICFFIYFYNMANTLNCLRFISQGFAAGLMLSISFLDLAHNAINSIGFLKGNLWVRCPLDRLVVVFIFLWFFICMCAYMQFFAGVIVFALVVNFIPEPTLVPSSEVRKEQVWQIFLLQNPFYSIVYTSTVDTSYFLGLAVS